MRSITPKKIGSGYKVGDVVDAMHKSGEFGELTREQIFGVVEIFLREYVGMPGTMITKKFTVDSAREISTRVQIELEDVVKIVTVFRIKASPGGGFGGVTEKFSKAFNKGKIKGGIKTGLTRG